MTSTEQGEFESTLADRRERAAARLQSGAAESLANEAIHRDTPATFERQVAESRTALVSQLESTNELLDTANNSTQSRAVAHRRTVQQRTASLDAEHAMRSSAGEGQYITAVSSALQSVQDPQILQKNMDSLLAACTDATASRERLRSTLHGELKICDDSFAKELEIQAKDTQGILRVARGHTLALEETYRNEMRKIDTALLQDYNAYFASMEADFEALMEERQQLESQIVSSSAQKAAANAEALRALRARCIQRCEALVVEMSEEQQTIERRLLDIQSEHIVAADMLRMSERQLAEKDAENANVAHQLKRQITRERAALQESKNNWTVAEKSLRDEQTKLNNDFSRGTMQSRQLDAKNAVLNAADSRRRTEIDVSDSDMLVELSTNCVNAVRELEHQVLIPVDDVALSVDFIADVTTALQDIAASEDTAAAAEKATRVLDALNTVLLSQRRVLETQSAIIGELHVLRQQPSTTR